MNHSDTAAAYFEQGYSCAQAVLLAFREEAGLTPEQAARLASPFGGGMARMREVCGAVSAMLMVVGLADGYEDADAGEEKRALYARVRALADAFRGKHGSINCAELLKSVPHTDTPAPPEPRTPEYHAAHPCTAFVRTAAELLEDYLAERAAR